MLVRRLNRLARAAVMGHAAAILFVVALPGMAFAQNSKGADSSSAPGDQVQPITDARALWLFGEPHFVTQGLELSKRIFGDGTGPSNSGFYPELSNMITGSGFISAGPGYRLNFNDNKALFDTSAALSWHLYKMAQTRLEFSQLADNHLTLGAQAMWQDETQVSYFGIGPGAVLADQSQYRLKTVDIVGYTAVRPAEWLSFGAEVGWLKSPQVLATAGSFNGNYPDARVLYANDPAMSAASQPNFLHSELSVTADTLDARSHPTEGGLYRAALTSYFDRAAGTYSFNQYEGEVVQMAPLVDRRVVLGLHGWTVFTDTGTSHQVPFYLMPSIGGHNTLRAYDNYQFHEQNTIVATAELRVALSQHLDLAAFYDAGSVAARYRDLNFDKTSIGGGLRLHLPNTTFARMDVAHGTEGWRVIFRTSEPFQLSRVTRRTAAAPFMP